MKTLSKKTQMFFISLLALFATASSAAVPAELTTVFGDLGTDVGTLAGLAAILFGLIRGGTAIFKIAAKFFGAAGA